MAQNVTTNNKKIFALAARHLVGGVDSPVRSFSTVGGDPILIRSGRGSKVYDYDGNSYIDYVLSWGTAIIGHAHPQVVRDVREAARSGFGFGATNGLEIELARTIRQAIPFIDKIRFVNSGTEAMMGAVRLARGYTGRDKIVKFENSYHGHADYLLVKSGSGLATLGIPSSAGVPKSFLNDTIIAPLGDEEALEKIFKEHGEKIAAVIIEPVGGNYGVIPPDAAYLEALKGITKKHGALLIFDEVITGFRFGFGSVAETLGITPDLITLGKIIGGGLPIGAYGGKEDIMKRLAPSGDVYQASTFSGNPIVMQSGLSTLKILKKLENGYSRLNEMRKYLSINLEKEAGRIGIGLKISHYGSMFSIRFDDTGAFRKFYRRMLQEGIYLVPSQFEANFLSFSHTQSDIEKTISAARRALGSIRR